MSFTRDKSLLFQQNEHRTNRAGIGRHPGCQLPLSHRLTPREIRQEHKLVRRNSMLRKHRIRSTMQSQVSSSQCQRKFIFRRHRFLIPSLIRTYTHEFSG